MDGCIELVDVIIGLLKVKRMIMEMIPNAMDNESAKELGNLDKTINKLLLKVLEEIKMII